MAYNYSKLNGKIIEICGSQGEFARLMEVSERTISLKLNNKVMFKQNEITKACQILKINQDEILDYFFTLQVQHLCTS